MRDSRIVYELKLKRIFFWDEIQNYKTNLSFNQIKNASVPGYS